jgi:NAD-dependent deacetylase
MNQGAGELLHNEPMPTEAENEEGTRRLLELLRSSESVVALTGAGISTASGIPDFRSPGGLWDDEDPMEVATLSVFERDPERFWRFYRTRLDMADSYEPNPGHVFLAHLAQLGRLSAVVTQNIDGLHQASGVEDGLIHEVHGSVRELVCLGCGQRFSRSRLEELTDPDGLPRCSCGMVLKPAVVLFEEMLPEEAVERSIKAIRECDLLLLIGSSMIVYPVAGFPGSRPSDSKMAVINNEATVWGADADVWLSGDIARRCASLSAGLGF